MNTMFSYRLSSGDDTSLPYGQCACHGCVSSFDHLPARLWFGGLCEPSERLLSVNETELINSTARSMLISGGGIDNVDAVVQVRSTGPDHPTMTVMLSRLEGNTHNLWEAIAVADGSTMSISVPGKWEMLTSPVTVKGTGSAFEGDVGTVFVLDHLYNEIGRTQGVPASSGNTSFTATVPYTSTFQQGVQEGVLAYYTYSQADGAIAGAILQKVLIAA